ncbi:hypothetical protein [Flavobacterium suncheonense]|uniref:Uncharacterized protein n=1 Tax=Flavobacterium suncheonense GH29-5 = DSM 17707 TaxID=1121899 RepID=A0A0A2MA73_9FLAO|nr:hypothetical protein [Flavobacterium suncheonense]KGO89577.1 hypothetical protein Q764_07345 [Flavobacterium suncheonense GH29-5 = DSM 17707]
MKRFVLPFLLGVVVTSGFAFKAVYDIKYDSAEVYEFPKFNGLCVFTDSEPLMPHDTIGKVKVKPIFNLHYTEIRDKLLKKCNETYPKASGIIISSYSSAGEYNALVIQFKK